ncbi:MAG: tetratricopeptide repeat protein [Gammaproteobacteria bacterium]|nr:tetratricopeptide repeat protein [Gammaproteobacteria bacterium]
MDDLLSEKEQLEQMRAWWSEYGRYVIAGIVIAVGLLVGFNQYKSSKLEAQIAASKMYETLAEHVTDGDLDKAEAVADDLAINYANTTYAAQSKLAMARLYMDKNRDQDAADILRELLALSGNDDLKHIGRLRLARILLYQDKAQDVVDLLGEQNREAFAALNSEMLGDAYLALGRIEDAGDAYRKALSDPSPVPTIDRALVQMKLADLPPVSTAAAAAGAPDPVVEPHAEMDMEESAAVAPAAGAVEEAGTTE